MAAAITIYEGNLTENQERAVCICMHYVFWEIPNKDPLVHTILATSHIYIYILQQLKLKYFQNKITKQRQNQKLQNKYKVSKKWMLLST